MGEAIVKIIAEVLGLSVALGIDAIVGKWVAYFEKAWAVAASKAAREARAKAHSEFAASSSEAFRGWEAWRKNKTNSSSPSQKG